MVNTSRILFVLGALASASSFVSADTKPEPRLAANSSPQAALYARADPLNLFGLRGAPIALARSRGDEAGMVLDAPSLARGMSLQERQRVCEDSGYGLCPTRDFCCPTGGQCCPGKSCCGPADGTCTRVGSKYGCCPPGRSCNGIDGCAIGRRSCSRDPEACCPTGSACIYDSSGTTAVSCSSSGSGDNLTGDNGSGQTVISSFSFGASTTRATSVSSVVLTSASTASPVTSFSFPSLSSLSLPSISVPTSVGGGNSGPFGAAPASSRGLGASLAAVGVALLAGALAI